MSNAKKLLSTMIDNIVANDQEAAAKNLSAAMDEKGAAHLLQSPRQDSDSPPEPQK